MMEDTPITVELNPEDQRLYDRLRARVVAPHPGGRSGLADLMLLLPDFVVLLSRLVRDDRVPTGSKWLAGLSLAYVLSPVDLMPVLVLGPLGLLDDLFLLGHTFSGLLNRVHPDVVRSHWPGQGDALDSIQRLVRWAERQLGGRFGSLFSRAGRSRS